jgi:tetratricopeptide (TPR) repeat protein
LNAAELQLLRLLYIFDRPVKAIELARIAESKTAGLSDQLPAITDAAWHQLTDRLRSRKLILPSRPYSSGVLDAHPLVRAYFGEFFFQRKDLREAAHKTVADDLRKALGGPPSDKGTTTRSVLAAYEVVSHVVAAGDFQQAMTIHWEYVRCGRQYWNREYSLLSTDLSIWSEFFRVPWSELRPELEDFGLYRPFIFSEAAWNLFALGRPDQAVEAAKVAFRESVSNKQWLEVSGIAENLSGYLLSLGRVRESDHFAAEALRHSSNPERNEWLGPWPKPYPRQVQARVMAARVALYKYDLAECAKLMREAEEINRRFYGDSAVRGYGTYTYVDMLLEQGLVSEALDRAEQTLRLPETGDSDERNERPEITVGIERIALGRAYADARDFPRALVNLDDGVGMLRQVGRVDVVVLSLLERARVRRLIDQLAESEHDLRYARRIADRAGLEPLLAMAELEMAELLAAQNRQGESVTELQLARRLAQRTQYEYLLRRCERFASRLEGRRDGGRAR